MHEGRRSPTRKPRILFIAEAATLAHVVRSVVLATTLDAGRYEVGFATARDFRAHAEAAGLAVRELYSIGTRAYLDAVSAGRPVYPYATLERYVEDDLRVIAEFEPDLIVGDFRLSLAVSARLAKTPYLAISNAYWSPLADAPYEAPVHAATRMFGPRIVGTAFDALRPLIIAQHAWPMRRLRRRHGMPSLGLDLRAVFTEGDTTLFADVPAMVPTAAAASAARYRYIGPVVWSPPAPLPEGLDGEDGRPLVYVSLGSSGDPAALGLVVDAVVACGARAVVAAPSGWTHRHGDAVVARSVLPGSELAARAKVVVCNGGSPGSHQALEQGTPVLGIPANLDQLLNMRYLVRSGAGLSVRADELSPASLQASLRRLLSEPAFGDRARAVQREFAHYPARELFPAVVDTMLGPASGART
ncbi:glycosyltransferase [Rubrivivax gelatinosus]|uniref:Putative glucosyltransferase n=1 Tax=Rubrivivax gelatinosus (strain NBRC 100245 / IL144) TaxID=983917 RepID=I0HL23_RUBGI|nr:nucleotide disphospho-sugar-binding domain-containing protein [Rubrivivax gelatinosus]BAL93710.1 putative glucosyltransferase [Rubrivivax gelatinosus IL144]